MVFDPDKHNRQSKRLYGYDYTVPGYYYVTICTKNRLSVLGTVIDDVVILSAWGRIAYENWRKTPEHFSSVGLDDFVIMPNHIHGVIILRDADATKRQTNPPEKNTPINVQNVGAQHTQSAGTCALDSQNYTRFNRSNCSFIQIIGDKRSE